MHELFIFIRVLLTLLALATVGTLLISPLVFLVLWCTLKVGAWADETNPGTTDNDIQ